MLKLKILTVALFLFLSQNLFADNSPFQFLRFQSSARSAGLAGCFVTMTGDPNAVFFNPATISTVKEKPFSVTFLKHVLDINSGLTSYVFDYQDKGIFAGSISYTNYGSFVRADKNGNKSGTFSANNLSLAATYSNELDSNFYYGVSLKFITINLEKEMSMAFAVDAGLIYSLPDERTNVGVSILHAGTQLTRINSVSESLPLDIRAGINHRLRGLPLLVNFSLHHLAETTDNFLDRFKYFSIAGELYLGEYIQARLGFDNMVRRWTSPESDRKMAGITAEVGIKANDFNFDYGVSIYGSSAYFHRFSLGFNL